MNDEMLNFMLEHMKEKKPHELEKKEEPKREVSPDEAIEIYREIIDIYAKHNVSYQCACRLSLAMNEALIQGAVELIRLDRS
jgi:hypothetical protein